jgi:hypothetical protein
VRRGEGEGAEAVLVAVLTPAKPCPGEQGRQRHVRGVGEDLHRGAAHGVPTGLDGDEADALALKVGEPALGQDVEAGEHRRRRGGGLLRGGGASGGAEEAGGEDGREEGRRHRDLAGAFFRRT